MITVEQAQSDPGMMEGFVQENYGLIYSVAKKYCQYEKLTFEEKLENIQRRFGGKYLDVLKLRMQDKTQMEIAKKIGITQVEVSRILKRIREFFF